MLQAIATTAIPGDLDEKMRAAARAGSRGIEVLENDLLYFDSPPEEVRHMAGDLGLAIVALQPCRDSEAWPAGPRRRSIDPVERFERCTDPRAVVGVGHRHRLAGHT